MLRRAGILLLHLAAVLLPLLAGWGWSGLRSFVAEPARFGLLLGIFAGAAAFLLLGIDLNPLRAGELLTPGQGAPLLALALASLLLLWFLPFADHAGLWVIRAPGLRWAGLLLCLAGGVIRLLALHRLGPHFSAYLTLQPGHALIENGIYGWIRHPLYLSLLLAGPGLALVFQSQLVLPILLAALSFIGHRIPREEALLASRFGPQFSGYRARTWALVPLLY